jgi:2-polyprenyl-3-methyl-5-hydroxy-6-metoxy-1,4-benzoquinol methylase
MAELSPLEVQAFFDTEVSRGRRLLPDPATVSGLGTFIKYRQAACLMAGNDIHDVLDVGCNRGSTEALFQSLYPEQAKETFIEGVDISSQAVKQATALGLANCTFRTYEGSRLPYPSESFDLVILIEVIEHVAEKEQLLREIRRVLRPEGKLFLTTPNPECWALQAEIFLWRLVWTFFRKTAITKDAFVSQRDLTQLLSSSAFRFAQTDRVYAWPRAFVYFRGWSLFPPLPPKALYRYQKLCLRLLDHSGLPEWIDKRLKWSLVALLQKSEQE